MENETKPIPISPETKRELRELSPIQAYRRGWHDRTRYGAYFTSAHKKQTSAANGRLGGRPLGLRAYHFAVKAPPTPEEPEGGITMAARVLSYSKGMARNALAEKLGLSLETVAMFPRITRRKARTLQSVVFDET